MPDNTLLVLIEARAIIAKPERWTTKTAARDQFGEFVEATSYAAVRFCALGALDRTAREFGDPDGGERAFDALRDASIELYGREDKRARFVGSYVNDVLGHEAILSVFDRAIEKAAAA